ncbi:hypothetical protein LVY75_08650 (plasmid) [Sinorhizobium sp. B11]
MLYARIYSAKPFVEEFSKGDSTGMTWLDSSEVRGKFQPENELTKSLAGAIFHDGNNDTSGGSRLLTRWINAALALKFIS